MLCEIADATLRDEVVPLCRDLIRLDTSNPPGHETPAAGLLRCYLEASGVECELVANDPERANLVARLRGTGDGPSLALLGHTDVVPAVAADWRHPPFEAHLDSDGYLWGRGAVDMKNETASRAVALALLARGGFRPGGDIVFVAEADEEDGVADVGLKWLVRARPDVRTDYAINEGGGQRLELSDGRVVVTVSVAEKATQPFVVTAVGEAGHASTPTAGRNAVPLLAELVGRLARHRPAWRLLPVTERILDTLVGPGPDLDDRVERAVRLHPVLADLLPALLSMTMAPTMLSGSGARNVMPARASAEVDSRLLPDQGRAEQEAEVRAALGDDVAYELSWPEPRAGGTSSPLDTPLYGACQRFVDRHDPGAVLLPTMGSGFTDSHFLREAFGTVAYGFWPSRTTPPEVQDAGCHNRDERIHVDDLVYATRFHLELARELSAPPAR